MESKAVVAKQAFNYLKETVSSLLKPRKENDTKNNIGQTQVPSINPAEGVPESLDAVARRGKRKRSLSPSSEPVSKYGRSLMIFSGSQGSDVSKYSQFVGSDYSFSETVPNALENPALRQTLCFNQLLWTLKYLKFNPFKTSDEALEMIGTLCNGASEIATLSGFSFKDEEFRRFLRIADTLFTLIKTYSYENPILTTIQVNIKLENLLDDFLDQFTTEESNAEGQLRVFGFVSSLIDQVQEEHTFVESLVHKLLLRVCSTTTAIWKACVACPKGSVQLIQPQDINLFFFYNQLLELVITCPAPITNQRLNKTVYSSLTSLQEDTGSLFSMFPTLAFTLYSTILSTGIPMNSAAKSVP